MSTRRIKLSFSETGESVLADLLDTEAPGTCELIWSRLPVESRAIHGMYSGAEIFTLLDDPDPAPAQNKVQLPLPGELLYFFDEGAGAVGARKPVGEICLAYGRGVVLRGHEGVPTHASLFARIPGDWKYDWAAFAQACRRCRWEGPQLLLIERVIPDTAESSSRPIQLPAPAGPRAARRRRKLAAALSEGRRYKTSGR